MTRTAGAAALVVAIGLVMAGLAGSPPVEARDHRACAHRGTADGGSCCRKRARATYGSVQGDLSLSDGDRAFIGPFEPVAPPPGDGNEPSALLIPVP